LGLHEMMNCALSETIAGYLREKQLLLVIDNCEHLVTACAELGHELLSRCPNLQIL
jgi:predicted ATPase